ncbi:MAG: hypothetical protein M1338_01840 [Patescibacteria group bacterium]|nr:hypothetical protein [Patescibacteria group bacterium]
MNKGFGIIEVVVAVSIMIIIVSGAAILEKNAIRNSVLASERTQAYNLAREGVEAVRAIRDSAWIDGTAKLPNWWQGLFVTGDHKVSLEGSKWALDAPPIPERPYGNIPDQLATQAGLTPTPQGEKIDLDKMNFYRIVNFTPVPLASPYFTNIYSIADPKDSDHQVIPPDIFSSFYMVRVSVTVVWQSYGKANTVSNSEYLTDWKPVY